MPTRIGIVTVHSVPNYGAMLQAYGLAAYLRSQGFAVNTVDYRQPQLAEVYRLRWKFPPPVNHWLRLRRSASFVRSLLPLTARSYHSAEEFAADTRSFDAFITGSDQVWFTGPVQYYDRMYFLDFPSQGQRRISYAASAGGTTDFGEFRSKVAQAIGQIDHLGVRDAHTASLVAPFAARTPVETVDPVFMHDFAELTADRSPLHEPYLLVFGDFRGPLASVVSSVSQATGLRAIVSLQYPCPAATLRVPAPSPPEWLNWIRHSAFVLTSYFHGTVAAVKYQRPFLSVPTPGRRVKVATLLEPLGLAGRCFQAIPTKEAVCATSTQPVAWSSAHARLDERISASRQFLANALR